MNFFEREIKRANLNWLLLCSALTLIPILLLGVFYNSFEHYLNQPIPIPYDANSLEKEIAHPSETRQYQIPFTKLTDSGIISYVSLAPRAAGDRNAVPDEQVLSKLYLAKIGDKYLPVQVDRNRTGQNIVGVLYPLDPEIKALLTENPRQMKTADLFPVSLSTTQYIEHDFYFNGIAWIVSWLMIGGFWYRLIIRMANPENHPNAKTLQYFGNTKKSILEINNEFLNFDRKTFLSKQQASRNWLAKRHLFRTEFQKFSPD